jgi:hypothetical protein
MPRYSQTLPRPIPPDVLDQFGPLLEKAAKTMKEGRESSIITAMLSDGIGNCVHLPMMFVMVKSGGITLLILSTCGYTPL